MPTGVYERTPEHRRARLGRTLSPEHRAAIGKALRGLPKPLSQRLALRGNQNAKGHQGRLGQKASKETRAKISAARRDTHFLMVDRYGYGVAKFFNTWILAHRLAHVYYRGPIPAGQVVHHQNGDKLDNREENLAVMSPSEHSRLRHAHA